MYIYYNITNNFIYVTHISEGNPLYVWLVSEIPPGKPEQRASLLKAVCFSTFKVFPRRDYSLSLTPTSCAAGASYNRVPAEMMSFKSCDLSSLEELEPRSLSPEHALCTYIDKLLQSQG